MKTIIYQCDTYFNTLLPGRLAINYYRMSEYCEPSIIRWCQRQGYDHKVIRPKTEGLSQRQRWPAAMISTINVLDDFRISDYDRMLFLDYDIYIPESFSFPWIAETLQAPSYRMKQERDKHLKKKVEKYTGLKVSGDSYLFCVVALDKAVVKNLQIPRLNEDVEKYMTENEGTVYSNDELTLLYHINRFDVRTSDLKSYIQRCRITSDKITHFGGGDGKQWIRRMVEEFEMHGATKTYPLFRAGK